MSRKRIITGVLIVFVLVVLGYSGYKNYLAPLPATPTTTSNAGNVATLPTVISVEGRVVPAQHVRLSFNSGGVISEVFYQQGAQVILGDVIARLESFSQFEAALTGATLQLVSAQQSYDSLFDNLDVKRALAFKAVADGRAAVRNAEQRVINLGSPAAQTDIDQAQANLTLAEYQLEKAQDDFEPYRNKPEDNLVRAAKQSALAQAQKEYDAALRLLNNLEGNANDIDIDQAQADFEVATALLALAELDYEDLGAGPSPDDLELAQANLSNAQAHSQAAEDGLAQQELRAPFSGTLVSLDLKSGEFVAPGISVVVLADLTSWRIETTDLAENDVVLLTAGQTAKITIDAFSGENFSGVVIEIGLLGEDSRGSITYPVVLSFDPGEFPVRWGMTAFVDISLD